MSGKLGIERARAASAPSVGTEHLLHGVLAEGGNLALHVLRAVEVEPDHVARELGRVSPAATASAATAERFSGRPVLGRIERLEQHVGLAAAGE